MIIMGGRATYAFVSHDSASTSGSLDDVQTIRAPSDEPSVAGVLISVEGAAIRVTFDASRPQPDNGVLLEPGVHFLAFAPDLTFVSGVADARATVSVAWVKETVSTGS